MERRNFLKAAALSGAATALESCGHPEHELIRFIPEEDITPGIAEWKPGLCTLCPAGCGLTVRVMDGDAEVIRNGKPGLIKMGLAKKLEGNPNHPVNRGKLCPRGQAGLQLTYHPDRLRHPLRRGGSRGSAQFQEISWDDATKELASRLAALTSTRQESSVAFITRPLRGQRAGIVDRFLKSMGAPPAISFELLDESALRRANQLSFGHAQLPTFDLARANYVLAFGADFLGVWNSPVSQSIAYGEMRQGRAGIRGKFVMVEQRVSQTGANADEWIAAKPGTEGMVALGIAHVILQEKLRPTAAAGRAGSLLEGWSTGLPDYSPEAAEKKTGVPAATLARIAHEMAAHQPAVAIIGGAPLAQTNGLSSALAVNALNELLGSVEKPGGVFFAPAPAKSPPGSNPAISSFSAVQKLVEQIQDGGGPKVLLVDDANPVFASPEKLGVREALEKIPFIASFGSFIDETAILADLILPDHSPLESWLDHIPESGANQAVISVVAPAMRPLHNTRALPDVLLDVAKQMGGKAAAALPEKSFEDVLKSAYADSAAPKHSSAGATDDAWEKIKLQGGVWSAENQKSNSTAGTGTHRSVAIDHPKFDGPENDFPFHLQPYASQMFYDGSLAHLPWMQETPDPLSTAMWGSWVELNPQAAARLGVSQGDLIEVSSQHGRLQAPALIFPGIAPDVVAMPMGQGHEHFGRYASGRGANPISILAPLAEAETNALAWAATRVRISKVGEGKLILFAGGLREHPEDHEQR